MVLVARSLGHLLLVVGEEAAGADDGGDNRLHLWHLHLHWTAVHEYAACWMLSALQ